MGSLEDNRYGNDDVGSFPESPGEFRRTTLRHKNWNLLKRYVIALFFFILVVLHRWKELNCSFMLIEILYTHDETSIHHTFSNWTISELENYHLAATIAEIFVQIPGAILIFIFSGYKFLSVSAFLSGLLHLLMPLALQYHSYILVVLLLAQGILGAPTEVAMFSVWKDWAPPFQRTRLILFSFYGYFVAVICLMFFRGLTRFLSNDESFYVAGSCTILWSIVWYAMISERPLISENTLFYPDADLPMEDNEKKNVKDVPWLSIVLSKPVIALSLVYFKVACSAVIMVTAGFYLSLHLIYNFNILYTAIPFLLYYIIMLPCLAYLSDYLIRRFKRKSNIIRKAFLCGGFLLHAVVLLGMISNSELGRIITFCISYALLCCSIPGYITLALDLSPRYVAITAGILYTFYCIGLICFERFFEEVADYENDISIRYIYLADGLMAVVVAVIFAVWGSSEEQPWTAIHRGRRATGYQSYPRPDDEDDLKLMTDPL